MWFDQSRKLNWEDVVDTLFSYGLVNRSTIELANRHKVDWEHMQQQSASSSTDEGMQHLLTSALC